MTNPPAQPETSRLVARLPWTFLIVAVVALLLQLMPGVREIFVYDRAALSSGDWWRIWTGHLIHFGWPHWIADVGLWLILGFVLAGRHLVFSHLAVALMPAFISAVIFCAEPDMLRYGGLSAINLGLLLYLALQGWRRQWTDWFWPAVLLIYVGEIIFELLQDGSGGGLIRFDEPGIRIATGAHLAGAAYALLAMGTAWLLQRRSAAACHP
jgi:rhomboid family GlyGly-CTERM serine protease